MKKEVVLAKLANNLRVHVLKMTSIAGSGHPSTCLSSADLVACLFFDVMRWNPKFINADADEFILSKGHAAPLLYAAFAQAGCFPKSKLLSLRKFVSPLEGHPTPRLPQVKVATGSLGQGLSIGVGQAIANRINKSRSKIFVLLGDGECAEGSVWEAASLAVKESLSNIVAIVDVNRLGQSGESLHGHNIAVWEKKWRAFGWDTKVIDGHNVSEILFALKSKHSRPFVILAKTVKGKGVSFLENKDNWHGRALSNDELSVALKELAPLNSVKVSFPKLKSVKANTVSKKIIPRSWSGLVATREAYGVALLNLGQSNPFVVALDGDVKNSTFVEAFANKFPKRFVDSFIAEQNMIGMAVGLSAKGFVPFVSSFAAFLSRGFDFIRMAAIGRANIKLVGSHCGVSIGGDGPSQMGLEDVAMMRSIPNSVILYPCDAISAQSCTYLLAKHHGIGYLRVSRPKTAVIYSSSGADSFSIGGSKLLRHSKRSVATVVAAGITVHEALNAADVLSKKGILIDVIDAYSIKPLDVKSIASSVNKTGKLIVVEDHYSAGGLGEAIFASIQTKERIHLCVKELPRSGSPDILLKHYNIDSSAIIRSVLK